ncbi:hypothetical protein AB0J83_41510 [Actinoplanes sp. NPDC049596]|uniref:hypothetical protein n=1 Tax=unclassified Actinoplanes TaxID=2626549 RepID=UPI003433DD32
MDWSAVMCDVHGRDAKGPDDTQDLQVPESWLTEEQLAEKVAHNIETKGYHICNELTDEEWVETAQRLIIQWHAQQN